MTAFSGGAASAATCNPLNPPQLIPIMPTVPLHQGCAATSDHLTASSSSCCGIFVLHQPFAVAIAAHVDPHAGIAMPAKQGWVSSSRARFHRACDRAIFEHRAHRVCRPQASRPAGQPAAIGHPMPISGTSMTRAETRSRFSSAPSLLRRAAPRKSMPNAARDRRFRQRPPCQPRNMGATAKGAMTQPNILILMVDQLNGTLFPDGPADWLHAPNLKRLAARSARFANSLYRQPALRARARQLHVRPAALAHPRL